jgi:hypothetical protein
MDIIAFYENLLYPHTYVMLESETKQENSLDFGG